MDLSSKPAGTDVQLAEAERQELEALKMARALERLGAPDRDIGYAVERAQAARARKLQLRRVAGSERPG